MFKLGDFVKQKNRIYIDLFAILTLCLVAGFRDASIGTDTAGYIRPLIDNAIASDNFTQYLHARWTVGYVVKSTSQFEIGYILFVYAVSRVFRSIVMTQTALELLIVLPVYRALRIKGDVSVWFGMLVYIALFFNPSLNLNRQAIAMGFLLLAFAYWMKGKKAAAVITFLIGFSFHYSCIIGLVILFIYEFIGHHKKGQANTRTVFRFNRMLIVLVAGMIFILAVNPIISLLKAIGLSRFTGYINGQIHFMPNQIIRLLPPFISLLLSYKGFKDNKSEWAFYVVMMVYAMIVNQFTSVNTFSGRIGYYFNYFSMFSYPLATENIKYKRTGKVVMIAYLAFYWWFYFVSLGMDATVPYKIVS